MSTSPAYREFCQASLYFQVARLMVEADQISPELAACRAFRMDEAELNRRLSQYAGTELSVAGPKPQSGQRVFYPVFSPATTTAGWRHSIAFLRGGVAMKDDRPCAVLDYKRIVGWSIAALVSISIWAFLAWLIARFA